MSSLGELMKNQLLLDRIEAAANRFLTRRLNAGMVTPVALVSSRMRERFPDAGDLIQTAVAKAVQRVCKRRYRG